MTDRISAEIACSTSSLLPALFYCRIVRARPYWSPKAVDVAPAAETSAVRAVLALVTPPLHALLASLSFQHFNQRVWQLVVILDCLHESAGEVLFTLAVRQIRDGPKLEPHCLRLCLHE